MKNTLNRDFHDTLHQVIDEVAIRLEAAQAQLLDGEWQQGFEPVSYETTFQKSFALATLKGKPTRKFFHISIYRLPSGRYELTTYIL